MLKHGTRLSCRSIANTKNMSVANADTSQRAGWIRYYVN